MDNGEIVEEMFFGLVFFINGFVHDIHTSEDIAMDTFSDLIAYKHRYNFKVSLKTYLYMIGKSKAYNYIDHRSVLSFTELSDAGDLADEETLEEKVVAGERKKIIRDALDRLPYEMREAVYLIFFEDMTYKEAAKVMRKSPKQVDNLLYRAKKKLKEILGERGENLL